MGIMNSIKGWFQGIFNKIKKMWGIAQPFFKEVLSKSVEKIFISLQGLAIEAVTYVATQGLPTDKAKQDAFKDYMSNKAKDQIEQLKDSEIALLRETALAIYKKSQE